MLFVFVRGRVGQVCLLDNPYAGVGRKRLHYNLLIYTIKTNKHYCFNSVD